MEYQELARFIESEMRMSQVYQPVFISIMLGSNDGTLTEAEAAEAFREVLDPEEDRVFNVAEYPGEVLIGRGVIERTENATYRLLGFEDLLDHERRSLIKLCDARLESYLTGQTPVGPQLELGPGRVYILMSDGTPSLFKIGYTTTRAEYRAKEISRGTGVPSRFEVYYESVRVPNAYQLEREILNGFSDARPNPRKEFLEMRVLKSVMEMLPPEEEP
ncbi:GIY-YIG nuclease family protein [Gemmatimonadales bacterium]|nr:GIY-YIG nuclease family protein [Gemmatimonadales bacterium]